MNTKILDCFSFIASLMKGMIILTMISLAINIDYCSHTFHNTLLIHYSYYRKFSLKFCFPSLLHYHFIALNSLISFGLCLSLIWVKGKLPMFFISLLSPFHLHFNLQSLLHYEFAFLFNVIIESTISLECSFNYYFFNYKRLMH